MKYIPNKGWVYEYVNGYPVLGSPIQKKYANNRRTIMVNQLFGESAVPFYDENGHRAWDLKTTGRLQFLYNNLKGFVMQDRVSPNEENGTIAIQATHSGTVMFAGQDSGGGRYVRLLSDELEIQGKPAKIETLSYHLDSWRVEANLFVPFNAVVGNAGNTGKFTTGPHLHFGVRPHWKKEGGIFVPDYDNGRNGFVDPMPFMADGMIYQKGVMWPRYFQFGKEVSKSELIY